MEAAKSGAEEAVYLLLAAGADVELTDAVRAPLVSPIDGCVNVLTC